MYILAFFVLILTTNYFLYSNLIISISVRTNLYILFNLQVIFEIFLFSYVASYPYYKVFVHIKFFENFWKLLFLFQHKLQMVHLNGPVQTICLEGHKNDILIFIPLYHCIRLTQSHYPYFFFVNTLHHIHIFNIHIIFVISAIFVVQLKVNIKVMSYSVPPPETKNRILVTNRQYLNA